MTPQHPPKVQYTQTFMVKQQQDGNPTSQPCSHWWRHCRGKPVHREVDGYLDYQPVKSNLFQVDGKGAMRVESGQSISPCSTTTPSQSKIKSSSNNHYCSSTSRTTTPSQSKQGSQLASCRAVFCTGFHVVTSTTHGVHMDTTWHPCGYHVVSCGNHIVSTFETMCCSPGNHTVSTWKPNGVHLETTWCAHGNHIISTWQPCSVHRNYMVFMWKPCGVHMETMWFSHGNYVVSTFELMYCPPGNHMVSTWKLGGVHLDTMWC